MEINANLTNTTNDINQNTIIKNRRGSANEWASSTYILKDGEVGVATDTGEQKVGDGAHRWSELISPYYKKPNDGIPKTDLASEIQNSLTKADSAIQSLPTATTTTKGITTLGVTGGAATYEHTHNYAPNTHEHTATDITSGKLNIAQIPTGTTDTTVALGNHTHSQYATTVHTHKISDINGLETELNNKATTTYVDNKIDALIGEGVDDALDTLKELGDALNNDPDFAATMTKELVGKAAVDHTHTNMVTGSDLTSGQIIVGNGNSTIRTLAAGTTSQYLRGDGTWGTPANDNTITRLRGTTSGTLVSGDITIAGGGSTTVSQSGSTITISSTDTKDWASITGKPSWIGANKPTYGWGEINDKPTWIGSSKPTYTASEVGAASASDLTSYLPLAGGTMTGNLTLNAPSHTTAAQIKWSKIGTADPFIGYALNQTDGTFLLMSLSGGDNYQNGLAIGGSSGNLLWKGTKVATVDDIPTVNNGTLTVQGSNGLTGSGTFTANSPTSPTITLSHAGKASGLSNLTASGRKYVTGLTFDDYGHVTGYTTGTETVTNTDTNYYHSTGTWDGLTYTAANNGGAPALALTLPTTTTTPIMDGTASAGTSNYVARSDHRHPTDTSRAAASDLANYLPLTGGTLSGPLKIKRRDNIIIPEGSTFMISQNRGLVTKNSSLSDEYFGPFDMYPPKFSTSRTYLHIDFSGGNVYFMPEDYPMEFPVYLDCQFVPGTLPDDNGVVFMVLEDIEISRGVKNWFGNNFQYFQPEDEYVFATTADSIDCYRDLTVKGTQLHLQTMGESNKLSVYVDNAFLSKNDGYEVIFQGSADVPLTIWNSPVDLGHSSGIVADDHSYGSSGQVLTSQGEGKPPIWKTVSGGGSGDTSNFVTLSGVQTISGRKTFTSYPTINTTDGIYFQQNSQLVSSPTYMLTLSAGRYGYTRAVSLGDLRTALGAYEKVALYTSSTSFGEKKLMLRSNSTDGAYGTGYITFVPES